MVIWWFCRNVAFSHRSSCGFLKGFDKQQKFSLVNVRLKWVKDKALDAAVCGQREVRAADILVSIIASFPDECVPIYRLIKQRGQLGLPHDLKLSSFLRRYPTVFHESYMLDSGGTRVPCFGLSPEAQSLHHAALAASQQNSTDLVTRLRKLLMLTRDRTLPLQTIDQLKWDLGLPYDYNDSLIPHHPDLFALLQLPDGRLGLKLLVWDSKLAVSQLQNNAVYQQEEEDIRTNCLSFPVSFTKGFGLKRKCTEWLAEWQKLPYTLPYTDVTHLDPRTDVSEKRIVSVFHELLHLTLQKKTERKNFSNLRKPLSLPQKFTKVFERHHGIFYISRKSDTQTVVLREGYDHQQLLQRHPLVDIRDRIKSLMNDGFLNRSRGLYRRTVAPGAEGLEMSSSDGDGDQTLSADSEPDQDFFSEYESDSPVQDPC